MREAGLMRIAVFDQLVAPTSPAGSCDLRIVDGLAGAHAFTLVASEVDVPASAERSISHVGVPSLRRPALAAFLSYLIVGCLVLLWQRLRGDRFDVVQATDCAIPAADVSYAHFCHRTFLAEVWPRIRPAPSLRTVHAWASHRARSVVEGVLARRARVIVVPSEGLRRDMARAYPAAANKLRVVQNVADLARLRRPEDFDPADVRASMRTTGEDTAFVFVALGHFERKGLPLLLDALAQRRPSLEHARLWVVGGQPDLIAAYADSVERLGLSERVAFAGTTDDVRPYLWSADAFVSPSHYEAFSLGLLEAAAAGLPLIATRISGSEELLADGTNGFEVERTADGVAAGLERFIGLDEAGRRAVGEASARSAEAFGPERFVAAWADIYESLGARATRSQPTA